MKSSRRSFLKVAGVSALGVGIRPVLDVFAASGESEATTQVLDDAHALSAKQWAMVIDTRKLRTAEDIEPLTAACHTIHNVPKLANRNHEVKWIWPEEYKHAFPSREHEYVAERIKHMTFPV